jgi:hypothetical protein
VGSSIETFEADLRRAYKKVLEVILSQRGALKQDNKRTQKKDPATESRPLKLSKSQKQRQRKKRNKIERKKNEGGAPSKANWESDDDVDDSSLDSAGGKGGALPEEVPPAIPFALPEEVPPAIPFVWNATTHTNTVTSHETHVCVDPLCVVYTPTITGGGRWRG